jgi:type VI secretion system protein ImpL
VEEYAECLDANPPVYLMLSKTDQLPGFSQAFDGLDLHERQQPLGMTFGLRKSAPVACTPCCRRA